VGEQGLIRHSALANTCIRMLLPEKDILLQQAYYDPDIELKSLPHIIVSPFDLRIGC
jgi:hypothetical protein